MATISVIVPVYNSKEFLVDCIDSVLAQRYCDWELIIVDDGSVDGSIEVCEKYAAQDERIHLIKGKHGGVGAARNLGLKVARGEYVTFLDSDDWLDSSCFQNALQMMRDCDILIYGIRRVPGGGLWCIERELSTSCNGISEFDFIDLLNKNYIASACAILFKSEIIADIFFDERAAMGEDLRFVFETLHCAGSRRIRAISVAYYNYRAHSGSSTTECNEVKIQSLYQTYRVLYEEHRRRDFEGGEYLKFVSKRLMSDLYYLSMLVEHSSLSKREKKHLFVELGKINQSRKNEFTKAFDIEGNHCIVLVRLKLSLRYFKIQKIFARYKNALHRRIGGRCL